MPRIENIFILFFLIVCLPLNSQSLKSAFQKRDINELKGYIETFGVDYPENGFHPIVVAAKTGNVEFVKFLIDNGADLNVQDNNRRTALMEALVRNHTPVAKLLVANDANPNVIDTNGKKALDLAIEAKNYGLIKEVFGSFPYADVDGPYIFDKEEFYEVYSIIKSYNGKLDKIKEVIPKYNHQAKSACFDKNGNKLFEFDIIDPRPQEAEFDGIEKICAISDIEGNLEAFTFLLNQAGVMNKSYEWTFGEGHLVLVGDFFDRGNQVTEVLWLAYRLEQEAAKAGGKVHFIIGNHEEMNLRGDYRYVDQKYKSNCNLLDLKYSTLYNEESILGQWLRTKPVMVRINDILFCHAGLSPQFAKQRISIQDANLAIQFHLGKDVSEIDGDPIGSAVFHRNYGPFWYRGVAKEEIPELIVEKMLEQYGARKMVIGHTVVEQPTALYNGKVINIDVKHARGNDIAKGLLIEGRKIYTIGEEKALLR